MAQGQRLVTSTPEMGVESPDWVMPDWMRPYSHSIEREFPGFCPIEEMVRMSWADANRRGVYVEKSRVIAQLRFLERLARTGCLAGVTLLRIESGK